MTISKAQSAELARLAAARGGALTPAEVVEAARSEASPLHSAFEWDDGEAAERWRQHQARQLIRVAVQYVPGAKDQQIECRVFASLTPDRKTGGAGYRLVSVIMADDEMRRQLLMDARAEMKRFTQKFRSLEELSDVFAAMTEAEDVIDGAIEREHAATA